MSATQLLFVASHNDSSSNNMHLPKKMALLMLGHNSNDMLACTCKHLKAVTTALLPLEASVCWQAS
jgi:hypothetical protein